MPDTFTELIRLIHIQGLSDVDALTPESSLREAGLDSLQTAELIFLIEDIFHVDLGDLPPEQFPSTINDLVAMVDEKRRP